MEQLHIIGGLRWLRDESCRPVRYGRLRRNAQKTHETVSSGDLAGGVTRIWAPMRARNYVQHGSAFSAENQGKAPSAQHNSELHITSAHGESPFPASVVKTDAGNQTAKMCGRRHPLGPPRRHAFVTQDG